MSSADVNAYIAKAQPFAIPILETLRARVRAGAPDVDEAVKWGAPAFMYKGKFLCNMAAFKAHAVFGFWHGEMVTGGTDGRMAAMGDLGKLTSVADLPEEKTFATWIAKAKQLIDDGVKPPHVEGRGKHPKPEMSTVPALLDALDANSAAKATWDRFPPGCRREYLEWIVGAKREETRDKRVATTIAQLVEGKRLNWKYEKC
jgi:uncharacterized protein YdeI (YjbR/CyaY-like superfamily)